MIFPVAAMAHSNLSAGNNPAHASQVDSTGIKAGALPLISSQEAKEGNYLGRLWRFLFKGEERHKAVQLKSNALTPDTLVLQQIKPDDIEQSFVIGSNGPMLTRFATDLAQAQALNSLEKAYLLQRRLEGGTLSGRILDLGAAQVALSGVYLQSYTSPVAESGLGARDHAWSLGMDIRLFSEQLQLYGEYAGTRHNSDPWGTAPIQEGSAYKLQLSYRLLDNATFLDAPLDWAIGVRHQQADRQFQSPAQLNGGRNISLVEGFTHLEWQGLKMDTSVLQEVHNLEHSHSQPSQYLRRARFSGQYRYRFEQPKLPTWLGLTGLNLQLSGVGSGATDLSSSEISIGAHFIRQAWDWNLRQILDWRSDKSRGGVYARSSATIVEAQFKLFDNRFSLAPELQYRRHSAKLDFNRQWAVGLDTHAVFIPRQLQCQILINAKQVWNGGRMKYTYSTGGNMNWQLTRRGSDLPAVRLFLKGHYQATWDRANSRGIAEDYLVLLGVAFD